MAYSFFFGFALASNWPMKIVSQEIMEITLMFKLVLNSAMYLLRVKLYQTF